MGKFIREEVVIEAIRYTGNNFTEVDRFIDGRFGKLDNRFFEKNTIKYYSGLFPPLPPGYEELEPPPTIINKGDWVTKGASRNFRICEPDIFDDDYKPIDCNRKLGIWIHQTLDEYLQELWLSGSISNNTRERAEKLNAFIKALCTGSFFILKLMGIGFAFVAIIAICIIGFFCFAVMSVIMAQVLTATFEIILPYLNIAN